MYRYTSGPYSFNNLALRYSVGFTDGYGWEIIDHETGEIFGYYNENMARADHARIVKGEKSFAYNWLGGN